MFNRLRELRKSKGYTCEQMANKLGLKKAAYSKKELGKVKFSLDDAKKVSDILGYSIDNIFFAKDISFKDTNTLVDYNQERRTS